MSEKFKFITAIDKIHSNSNCFHGTILTGTREALLFSFISNRSNRFPGFKLFCETGTPHNKFINKTFLSKITCCLEDDEKNKIDSNGETMTFI